MMVKQNLRRSNRAWGLMFDVEEEEQQQEA
jgi:hypothetical protein